MILRGNFSWILCGRLLAPLSSSFSAHSERYEAKICSISSARLSGLKIWSLVVEKESNIWNYHSIVIPYGFSNMKLIQFSHTFAVTLAQYFYWFFFWFDFSKKFEKNKLIKKKNCYMIALFSGVKNISRAVNFVLLPYLMQSNATKWYPLPELFQKKNAQISEKKIGNWNLKVTWRT